MTTEAIIPEAEKLNEKDLRKDTFTEGVPIVLADGQPWHFPKPMLEFTPIISGDNASFGPSRISYGMRFWELFENLVRASGYPDVPNALLNIALYLLRRNYELSDEQSARLLPYIVGDEENSELWRQVTDVALGNTGPKA